MGAGKRPPQAIASTHYPLLERVFSQMPYFVYKISPPSLPTYIGTEDRYQDARALVRRLRREQPPAEMFQYRMAFANSQAEAEKLLSKPRDERVIGED